VAARDSSNTTVSFTEVKKSQICLKKLRIKPPIRLTPVAADQRVLFGGWRHCKTMIL
jgi:hypothetical protein